MSATEDSIVSTDTDTTEAPAEATDPVEEVVPTAADLLPTGTRSAEEQATEAAAEAASLEGVPVEDAPVEADAPASAPDAVDEAMDEDDLLAPAPGEWEADEEPALKPESAYDRAGNWYVVHTQSGYEKKVKQNLLARRDSMHLEDRILEVEIPMEDVDEFRNGKKVTVSKKVFPGYLLVRCYPEDEVWAAIRDTPGIVNFVGSGGKPSRLRRKEVETFLPVADESEAVVPKRSKARFGFGVGETVRVKEGPFADFSGAIQEINEDQLKVKVLVNIFGRETPVELEFAQVAQL